MEQGDDSLFGDDTDKDSLFGGSDNGDTASLFTEDQSSEPSKPAPVQTLPHLTSPSLSLPTEPLPSLPPPPSEEVRISETHDVSTIPTDVEDSDVESELDLEQALDEEEAEQAIDTPQVGQATSQDPQACQEQQLDLAHHLRPRSTGFAPRQVDLGNPAIEALIPSIQLNASTTWVQIYEQLDLDKACGKLLVDTAKVKLAKPMHAIDIGKNSNQDPYALRLLKVTLIFSAIALLNDEGLGKEWFGSSAQGLRKSKYTWPADGSHIILNMVHIVYKVTRNERQRIYAASKKRLADDDRASVTTTSTTSTRSTPQRPVVFPLPPRPLGGSQSTSPSPVSPMIDLTDEEVGLQKDSAPPAQPTGLWARVAQQTRPLKKHQSPDTAVIYLGRVPEDANIRYELNVLRKKQRVLPRLFLEHLGGIRLAGYSFIVRHCVAQGLSVPEEASVQVFTQNGFQSVQDDHSWDRAIRKYYDDILMDEVIKVCVYLA